MDENITVEFPKGYFSESEIVEITAATDIDITFAPTEKHMLAAFDEIVSIVNVYFTSDFWTQVFAGLTVVTVTKGLQVIFGQIKKIIQSKKYYHITADKAGEQQPTIGIKGPNINIVLPTDISDEKFYYCIDKAFESVKDASPLTQKEQTITFYDDSTGNIRTYTINEYYWKKVVPRQDHAIDDTSTTEH